MMRSIFISYSRSNAEKAGLLTDVLGKEGIDVFAAEELALGSNWQAEILSAIRRCSVFVAFIDQPTPNVMLELGYALGASKQVLLVGSHDTRVPFDIASLPMERFDEYDTGSLFTLAERVRNKASAEIPPEQQFLSVRDRLDRMSRDTDYLEQVSPMEFESCVLAFLRELGFDAVQMHSAHEGGYDIRAKDPRTSFDAVIEVKKHMKNSMLGVSIVHQLLGAMIVSNASCAIVVTTTGFSKAALSMAKKAPRPILLITLEELLTSTIESITAACS